MQHTSKLAAIFGFLGVLLASTLLANNAAATPSAYNWVKWGEETRHCEHHSFGPVCHTQQAWFNDVETCRTSPIPGVSVATALADAEKYGSQYSSWYSYCYKYTA